MDLLKQAQRAAGSGLRGTGMRPALIDQVDDEDDESQKINVTSSDWIEPMNLKVYIEGETQRPATLRGGDLVPYALEDINETKETDFAQGRAVHTFRGTLRPGTSLKEGSGWLFLATGDIYVGRWRSNMRHGIGILTHPSGYAYEGHFKDDRPHGLGRETFPNGDVYLGEFVAGRPHGQGTLYYVENGARFEGSFVNGEKHGPGMMLYENGDVFRGNWVKGKRHDDATIGIKATGHAYAARWVDNEIPSVGALRYSGRMIPVMTHTPASPAGLWAIPPDMRAMTEFPEQYTDIHPVHFARIKHAFETQDTDCIGEVDCASLLNNSADVPEPLDAVVPPKSRKRADVVADNPSLAGQPTNVATVTGSTAAFFDKLQRAATRNGVSVDFLEYLTVLFPHIASADLKRWTVTDPAPEVLLRLRGTLANVPSQRSDGFLNITMNKPVLTEVQLQQNRGLIGGTKVTHAMMLRVRQASSLQTTTSAASAAGHSSAANAAAGDGVTFAQLLQQLFPNLPAAAVTRIEADNVPVRVLARYAASFDQLDDGGATGYVSLERLKTAQKKYQAATSVGVSWADACKQERGDPYYSRLEPGLFKHQARWMIGDVAVTVALVKQIDRARSGFISLLELLRYAYPNIACLSNRERLGVAVRAEESCRCCLCQFCGPRYARPRPANPYADGSFVW